MFPPSVAKRELPTTGEPSILQSRHLIKLSSNYSLYFILPFKHHSLLCEYLISASPPSCRMAFFSAQVLSGTADLEAPQLQPLFLCWWHLKRQQQLPIKGLCHLFPLPLLWDSSSYIQKNIYHSSFILSLKNEQEKNVFFHDSATALQKTMTLSLRKRAMLESKKKQQKFLMIDPLGPCTLKAILRGIYIQKWLLRALWKAKVRASHQAF